MADLYSLDTKQLYDLCLKIIDHKEKSHTYRDEFGGDSLEGKIYRVRLLFDKRDRTYEAALEYKKEFEAKFERLQEVKKRPEIKDRAARFVDGSAEIAANINGSLERDAIALIKVLNKSQKKYEKLADAVLKEAKPHENPETRPRHP